MSTEKIAQIEALFRRQVEKDSNVKNAYLLVHSDKLNLHLNIAAGSTGEVPANPHQPNYMASVGKLFTATIVSMLFEQGRLSFDDPLNKYLDSDLLQGLHVYKGKDYTREVTIRHLLKQTSGLFDNFWPLLKKMLSEDAFSIATREAIIWGKTHLESCCPPGKKVHYTDTNYHLLGLICEHITGKPFHELLHDHIFTPLGMKSSYMLHKSQASKENQYPTAHFSIDGKVVNNIANYANIDYAGGGVVSPMEDLLTFMQALVAGRIISQKTLEIMKSDTGPLYPSIEYGYSIWKIKTIPLLIPAKYSCWGCVGATGAFLFYHRGLDAYIIGNFNDVAYKVKGLKFMFKVIQKLYKS
ncbi:MAG: beta-lactamase family protein [Spirochaetales bacterium]|nr:beta-lactamase family protein [Spirochaetales bacterium]MCF7949413.1 beta-lactamase family protein [Spirochaetia bacterium]MCF7951595.1 beta-lactamase family protein [Spirochaetaceae bacterium]